MVVDNQMAMLNWKAGLKGEQIICEHKNITRYFRKEDGAFGQVVLEKCKDCGEILEDRR